MLKNTVAVTALLFFSFVASASQLPDYPFIHAGGSGLVRVPPDVGEIVFDISAYHAEPETARRVVEERIAEVRALVAAQALPEADVQIRDVRKDFRKADPAQPGVVEPSVTLYDIKCSVHIKVSDISKWQALVSPLINMPNLDGFTTSFDVSKREEVEAELTFDAIKAARRKAEVIAAGFGRKLGPVAGVSTGELRNLTRAMGNGGSGAGPFRPPSRTQRVRPRRPADGHIDHHVAVGGRDFPDQIRRLNECPTRQLRFFQVGNSFLDGWN